MEIAMPMPKGDAAYVNVILRWMTGDPETTTEHAYAAARELAERARRVLPTVVQPLVLLQAARLADRPHAVHQLLAGLLADCWDTDEDGCWSEMGVVEAVVAVLTAHGYDIRHPSLTEQRAAWPTELLRGIALSRPRVAMSNAVTHAEPPSAEGLIPECATDRAGDRS
jgi:hypothetical protein